MYGQMLRDDIHIGRLLYDWKTENITAWPTHERGNRSRTFFYKNMDQAKQYLIDQHVQNKGA